MSCPVCNGYPGCPCCAPEPQMITCPACTGSGKIYYNGDGEQISEEEYMLLSADDKDAERCDECNGTGYVEDIYEPYYD